MWDLNIINYRNQALAKQITAIEVNHLFENKIFPVAGFKLSEHSIERIRKFKEEQERVDGQP